MSACEHTSVPLRVPANTHTQTILSLITFYGCHPFILIQSNLMSHRSPGPVALFFVIFRVETWQCKSTVFTTFILVKLQKVKSLTSPDTDLISEHQSLPLHYNGPRDSPWRDKCVQEQVSITRCHTCPLHSVLFEPPFLFPQHIRVEKTIITHNFSLIIRWIFCISCTLLNS